MTNNSFEKLTVWQKTHRLVLKIYKITESFPKEEQFRLTNQLCRSASSIAANIVEGNSRKHKKEYLQFLNTAYSSLEETKYHLLLAKDLGYLEVKEYLQIQSEAEEINKMLNSLCKYLKSSI